MSNTLAIVLDSTLTPAYPEKPYINPVLDELVFSHTLKRMRRISPNAPLNMEGTGLFGMIETAYRYHLHVMLTPTDIHLHVLSQLAAIAMENAKTFEPIFVKKSGGDNTISMATDDPTVLPMDILISMLAPRTNVDMSMWMPNYSDTTPEQRYVAQAYLAAAGSSYYRYCTYLCGIPSIKLMGSKEEWAALANTVDQLCDQFLFYQNLKVLHALKERVRGMAESFDRSEIENKAFWSDIFSRKTVGCVSVMNGWIADLIYLGKVTPQEIEKGKVNPLAYYRSVALIPFTNETTQQSFLQVVGGFAMDETYLWCDNTAKLVYQSHLFEYPHNKG